MNSTNHNNFNYTDQPDKQPKKKLRFHFTKDGVTALMTLGLIIIIVLTNIVFTIKAIVSGVKNRDTETEMTTTETQETTGTTPIILWNENYAKKSVSNDDIMTGSLVLVNNSYKYILPSKIDLKIISLYHQTGHNTAYVISSTETELYKEIISPLANMLMEMIEANQDTLGYITVNGEQVRDRLLIESGYRTEAYQQKLLEKEIEKRGEEIARMYVAAPGYSEHHTGLAFDIGIMCADKTTEDLRSNEQAWIEENCVKYGFVLRYDGSKSDITKILDESWHFRFVDIPHAAIMYEKNFCLEEYINFIKGYTSDTEPFEYSSGGNDYLIYYVPVDTGSPTTFVSIPNGGTQVTTFYSAGELSSGMYTISGNNIDGFIVTVVK